MFRFQISTLFVSAVMSMVLGPPAPADAPKVDHENPYTIKDGDDVWIRLKNVRRGYVIKPVLREDHPVEYSAESMGWQLDQQGRSVIDNLQFQETRDRRDPETRKIWTESVGIRYPRGTIGTGDLVPVAGAVFRIINLTGNKNECMIYAKMVQERDLPSDVSWPRERHAIPIGGEMSLMYWLRVKVDDIAGPAAVAEGNKQSEPTARITVETSVRTGPKTSLKVLPPQTVRTGDAIELPIPDGIVTDGADTVKYYVRGIVPPDKEQRVIGWVLLESQKHAHGTREP